MSDAANEFNVPNDPWDATGSWIGWQWQLCNDSGSGCDHYYKAGNEYNILWVDGAAGGSTST